MNLPLNDQQATTLFDILQTYFGSIHDEFEKADDTTLAYNLLEQRREETVDLMRAFDAMIQGGNEEE